MANDMNRGSLLLTSSENFPRKSEESTYFESNASAAIAVPGTHGSSIGGSIGGGIGEAFTSVGMTSTGQAPTPAMKSLRGGGLGVAEEEQEEEKEEEETQDWKSRGREEGTTTREGGDGCPDGREPSASRVVIVNATGPAVLVRPPRVGDGKLEHDKERRLGVASDLEAVIAVSEVP